MDQVQEFALTAIVVHFGFQHLSNLKIWLIIHIDGRWGRLDPVRDRIGVHRFQHGYIEHWVDHAKAIQKTESDQVSAQLCNDLVRPEELVSKLLRQLGSAEELHLDIGLTPDQECQGSSTAGISQALVSELCHGHVFPEVVVELI